MANQSLGRYGGGRRPSGRVRGVRSRPQHSIPLTSTEGLRYLEAWHGGERRTSVCRVGTDPAPLPMGFGVRVGGPEAPGDRSLVGTEEGIRAGYPTVRKRLKAEGGRGECRREGSGTRAFAYRRPAWPYATRGFRARAGGRTPKSAFRHSAEIAFGFEHLCEHLFRSGAYAPWSGGKLGMHA
jgi:hypothetical protein